MEEDLRQLFIAKGLTEDHLASIEGNDDSLRSVGDLASGAVSETDARSWADELGLNARVVKSRFVQSWLEARSLLHMSLQIASAPEAIAPPVKVPESTLAAQAQALAAPSVPPQPPGGAEPTIRGTAEPAAAASAIPTLTQPGTAHSAAAATPLDAAAAAPPPATPEVSSVGQVTEEAAGGAATTAPVHAVATPHVAMPNGAERPTEVVGRPSAARGAQPPPVHTVLEQEEDTVMRVSVNRWEEELEPGPPRPPLPVHQAPTFGQRHHQPVQPKQPLQQASLALKKQSLEAELVEIATKSLAPDPEEAETFRQPGALSNEFRRLLRGCGITVMELDLLEKNLECRSCRQLLPAAGTKEGAMRLAFQAGITSKVSQENFAAAWDQCNKVVEERKRMMFSEVVCNGPRDFPLFSLVARGDFEACIEYVARRTGLQNKQDLVPVLASVLAQIARGQQPVSSKVDPGKIEELLPVLRTAYGNDVADKVLQSSEAEDAGWRWRWTLRTLFDARTAVALLRHLLEAYQSEAFKKAQAALNREWAMRRSPPGLEEKMACIQAVCIEQVLSNVLPRFGFSPDAAGQAEMKAAVSQHMRTHPEVRQLQVEISAAIMAGFKL